VIGQERFDDPLRQYRVLYAAAQRAGCFAETLAAFRPSWPAWRPNALC